MSTVPVTTARVQAVFKQQLGLSYRRTRTVAPHCNSQRCLVLQQQYALTMLPLLQSRTRIVNVDETWLSESTFYRKHWAPKG